MRFSSAAPAAFLALLVLAACGNLPRPFQPDDKSVEIAALFTERPVAAIAARVDTFHSFKVVKG